MFRFENPEYFLLFLPILAGAWFVYRKRRTRGILFSGLSRLPAVRSTWRIFAAGIMPAIIISGLALTVLALARPQNVFSRAQHKANVIAIEMVVDVSESMQALDLSIQTPKGVKERTRLDAVKEKFADFIKQRPDDLIGLITFGGYATTRSPLTTDHDAILHVLKGVETPERGLDKDGNPVNGEELMTAIGDALATACARIETSEPKSKIIVLLSDGISNTGIISVEQSIKIAQHLGVKVYTIGIGSKSGKVPFRDVNMFGRPNISYAELVFDEKSLKKIAEDTGGIYFHVSNNEALDSAISEIDKLEKTEIEREVYEQFHELFFWFLVPGIGLILFGAWINMTVLKRIV